MLALFAEGERLLRVVEAGDIELVIAELPEWQAQVMKMTVHKDPQLSEAHWSAQVQMLQGVAERIAQALAQLSKGLQQEMSAIQKQHSSAKAYISNSQ